MPTQPVHIHVNLTVNCPHVAYEAPEVSINNKGIEPIEYTAVQDYDADDPRTRIPDNAVAAYIYRTSTGYMDWNPETINNPAIVAFDRFRGSFDNGSDKALNVTHRYLSIFYPDTDYEVSTHTLWGHSQSDWWDVLILVAPGYGTAEPYAEELGQWLRGDVWYVSSSDGEGLGGIYAEDEETAIACFRDNLA